MNEDLNARPCSVDDEHFIQMFLINLILWILMSAWAVVGWQQKVLKKYFEAMHWPVLQSGTQNPHPWKRWFSNYIELTLQFSL